MPLENSPDGFNVSGRIRSVGHAIVGIRELIATQHNAWVHAGATLLVLVAGIVLDVSRMEWCVLILAISIVWVAEGLNTALELLCDVASAEFHPLVKKSKDIAAGAVLLSALGSAAIGLIIFIPALVRLV